MPGVKQFLIARIGMTESVEDTLTAQAAFNQSPVAFRALMQQMRQAAGGGKRKAAADPQPSLFDKNITLPAAMVESILEVLYELTHAGSAGIIDLTDLIQTIEREINELESQC